MDFKDVVKDVLYKAEDAHSAFHAGHHDVAKGYLDRIGAEIAEFLYPPATPAGDVTESATSEKAGETLPETPAQVPGAPAQPAAVDPAAETKEWPGAAESEKPIQ